MFLAHYAKNDHPVEALGRQLEQTEIRGSRYRDIQTYKSVMWAERTTIPEGLGIKLPSAAVEEVWKKE